MEKEILIQRGLEHKFENTLRGSWHVKNLISHVNRDVIKQIDSANIKTDADFVEFINKHLLSATSKVVFAVYLGKLSCMYPQIAARVDFDQFDIDFTFDSRVLTFLTIVKYSSFILVSLAPKDIQLPLFVVSILFMLNGISQFGSSLDLDSAYSNTQLLDRELDLQPDKLRLIKYKINKFLGKDVLSMSELQLIDCLYNPKIFLDYEFLFRNPFFKYHIFGKDLEQDGLCELDKFLILFKNLSHHRGDSSKITAQLKYLIDYYIKNDSEIFESAKLDTLRLFAELDFDSFYLVLPFLSADKIANLFKDEQMLELYKSNYLFLDIELDDFSLDVPSQSLTFSQRFTYCHFVLKKSFPDVDFIDILFSKGFDFSSLPDTQLIQFRNYLKTKFYNCFSDNAQAFSLEFAKFLYQQADIIETTGSFIDSRSFVFEYEDKANFDVLSSFYGSVLQKIDFAFKRRESDEQFLENLKFFIEKNNKFLAFKNLDDIFSQQVLEFLNQNEFWLMFDDEFFIKNSKFFFGSNFFVSIHCAVLNKQFAFDAAFDFDKSKSLSYGFLYTNDLTVFERGSEEYKNALRELICAAEIFDDITLLVFDFTANEFLDVLDDPKTCVKFIQLLLATSISNNSRINLSLLVRKFVSVIGEDCYYDLLNQSVFKAQNALLPFSVYAPLDLLNRDEVYALINHDQLAFVNSVDSFNFAWDLDVKDKLEFLTVLLSHRKDGLSKFDLDLKFDDFVSFAIENKSTHSTNRLAALFEYLYENAYLRCFSVEKYWDLFLDKRFQVANGHLFINKGYKFFYNLELSSYPRKQELLEAVIKFKIPIDVDGFYYLALMFFDNSSDLDQLPNLFRTASEQEINNIFRAWGSFLLIEYFHCLSEENKLYVQNLISFSDIDSSVIRIHGGALLNSLNFWTNLSFFDFDIQKEFLFACFSKQLVGFNFEHSCFVDFYLRYIEQYLTTPSLVDSSIDSFLPKMEINISNTELPLDYDLNLFKDFLQKHSIIDLIERNSYLCEFILDALSNSTIDSDFALSILNVTFEFFARRATKYENLLVTFIQNFDENYFLDKLFQLDKLKIKTANECLKIFAKIKYSQNLKVLDDYHSFVIENFAPEYSLTYLLLSSRRVVLKNINFILENFHHLKNPRSLKFLFDFEFNQVDSKHYFLLYDLFVSKTIRRSLTFDFINFILDKTPDSNLQSVFVNLSLLNQGDASIFLEYILRSGHYEFLQMLAGAIFTGRGLTRILGLHPTVDMVYNKIGELDIILIQLILYFENKIEKNDLFSEYLDEVSSMEQLLLEVDAVSRSVLNPKVQPELNSKISKYLFAVINGYFRSGYSRRLNFEEFFESVYSTPTENLETNEHMQDLVFTTDYYSQVSEFVLPEPTKDYFEWMQGLNLDPGNVDLSIDDNTLEMFENYFNLIKIPEDYSFKRLVSGAVSMQQIERTIFASDRSDLITQVLELNGVDLDVENLTKKQVKNLTDFESQIYEFVSNYGALVVSLFTLLLYYSRNSKTLQASYKNELPVDIFENFSLEYLESLNFVELKKLVSENHLDRRLIGFVSDYKRLSSPNVLDYPELIREELISVLFGFLPDRFRLQVKYFNVNSDFVRWNGFTDLFNEIQADFLSKLTTDSKRRSVLKKSIGLSALGDIQPPVRDGKESRILLAHNVRNLYLELSGFNVDACWADKYTQGIANVVSNVSFYKFSEVDTTSGFVIQRGGTLILEGKTDTGKDVWLVRGLNPRNDMYPAFCGESLVNNFLLALEQKACEAGAIVCVILDAAHASSTNRTWVREAYDKLDLQKITPLNSEDFVFNGYYNTPNAMYWVASNPLITSLEG